MRGAGRLAGGEVLFLMVAAKFHAAVRLLGDHPGMFTLGGSFAECCAYVQGLDKGLEADLLENFTNWLRKRGDFRPELAWPSLVLVLATGSTSVSDLSTEESAMARRTLFALLEDFLDGHAPQALSK